jgi:hypothetical protein
MALPTGHAARVPWLNSPSIGGEFIYRSETDEIVLKNGHHYARPQQIQAHSLRAAIYNGPLPPFEYFGTPPGNGAANFTFGNNRTQLLTPLGTPEPEQPFEEVSSYPTRTVSRTGPSQFIRSQDDKRVVFTTPTGSQQQQGQQGGYPGRGAPGIPINNEKLLGTLFPRYRPRGANFFSVGRVFMILCSEPTDGASTVTSWERGIDVSRTGGRPFTRVRRFVIIQSGPPGNSWALPISTYGGHGVARPGVRRPDHCIIFSGLAAPQPTEAELPRRGEAGMQPIPIRVVMNDPIDRLDPMSRMNLAGPILIDHNNRVRDLGVVTGQSAHDLRHQFQNVRGNRPWPLPPRPSGPPRP